MRTVGSGPYVDRVVLWNPEDTVVVSKAWSDTLVGKKQERDDDVQSYSYTKKGEERSFA